MRTWDDFRAAVERDMMAAYVSDYAPSNYFWLGILADEPYCDGDFENMECIEDDGDITLYFSGPIRELPDRELDWLEQNALEGNR